MELAASNIDSRIRALEVLAGRLDKADAAKRHEATVRRLAELTPPLRDIIADRDVSIAEPGLTAQVMSDIGAVVEQSRQAIKEANEAALSLVIPDDERGSRHPSTGQA